MTFVTLSPSYQAKQRTVNLVCIQPMVRIICTRVVQAMLRVKQDKLPAACFVIHAAELVVAVSKANDLDYPKYTLGDARAGCNFRDDNNENPRVLQHLCDPTQR